MRSGEALLREAGEVQGDADVLSTRHVECARAQRERSDRHRLNAATGGLACSRWAPPAILVAFSVLLSVAAWPGHIDADALNQIKQARTGHFTAWWAPIYDWMMRGLFLLGGSTGILELATILVVVLSLYELLRVSLSRWSAALAGVLIAVSPPVLGYLTALQRDVWFGGSTLLSYALLVRAVRSSRRWRVVCAVLSLVAVWFAMAARQNAMPALIPGVVIAVLLLVRPRPSPSGASPPGTAAAIDSATGATSNTVDAAACGDAEAVNPPPREGRHRRRGRRPLLIATLTVAVFGAFYLSQNLLTYHVIGAARVYPQQELFEEDLAGISLREHVDLLPSGVFPAQNLTVLRKYYSPATIIPLIEGKDHPLITYAKLGAYHQLRSAWEHAVLHDPVGYFHARWNLWMAEIDWNQSAWAPYHPGIDKNALGLTVAFPVLDNFLLRYLEAFGTGYLHGGVVTKAWIYLVVSPFLGLSLIRRRRAIAIRIIGFMVLGAFVYTMTYAVLAMADTFRWNWLLVTATLTGLVVQGAETFDAALERRLARPAPDLSAAPPTPAGP